MQDKIISTLNNSKIIPDVSELSDLSATTAYSLAMSHGALKQLHSILLNLGHSEKLKDYYHWKNLRAALKELDTHENADSSLNTLKEYINYHLNFGHKYLLVSSTENTLGFSVESSSELTLDLEMVADTEELDAQESSYSIQYKNTSSDGTSSILIHETGEEYNYVTPENSLLSEAGQQFQANMKLKKRTVLSIWHKVVINPGEKLKIVLVDGRSLKKDETPADKATSIMQFIKSTIWNEFDPSVWKRQKYFNAISNVYSDPSIGVVTGGYFITDSGSRYANRNNSDLRSEPFQKGGESVEATEFIKLDLEWPQVEGQPQAWLHGSAEMRENPEISLPWVRVKFSTKESDQAGFLKEVLSYAK